MAGGCMMGGMHGRSGISDMYAPLPPFPGRYYGYGIWSMSGRYASYWNAFLLDWKVVIVPCYRYNVADKAHSHMHDGTFTMAHTEIDTDKMGAVSKGDQRSSPSRCSMNTSA